MKSTQCLARQTLVGAPPFRVVIFEIVGDLQSIVTAKMPMAKANDKRHDPLIDPTSFPLTLTPEPL